MKLDYISFVHLFHIIFVGALFLYVGIERTNIPPFIYPLLKYLGIFVILYHCYKTYLNFQNKKSVWINLLHILLIGPLLVTIGKYEVNTSRKYFEMLLMAGFAAIGYHGYYLLF